MRNVHRFAIAMVFLAGVALTASALVTPAKAAFGQFLLERAWAASRAEPDAPAPRAWPWADAAPIAKLHFPRLEAERLVLDNASGEAMAWAPGHVVGTRPLGEAGVSMAAAHRDTHFALLAELRVGDEIVVETRDGRRLTYEMVASAVVDSRVWRAPDVRDGPDVLMLSTCWPFDAVAPGPERYVISAIRVAGPETIDLEGEAVPSGGALEPDETGGAAGEAAGV